MKKNFLRRISLLLVVSTAVCASDIDKKDILGINYLAEENKNLINYLVRENQILKEASIAVGKEFDILHTENSSLSEVLNCTKGILKAANEGLEASNTEFNILHTENGSLNEVLNFTKEGLNVANSEIDILKDGLIASEKEFDILHAESKPSRPLLDGGKWLWNKGGNVCSTVWNKVPSMSDVKSASFQCLKNAATEGKAIVTQPMTHKAVIGSGLVGLGLGGYAASKMMPNHRKKAAVGGAFVGAIIGGVCAPYCVSDNVFDGFKWVSNVVCNIVKEHPKTALVILGTVTVSAVGCNYYKVLCKKFLNLNLKNISAQ